MNAKALPTPYSDSGLSTYLNEIRQFPVLEAGEEFELASRWRDSNDTDAAHRLVTSHLRLAAKMAMGYRGYGLPMVDVISEANLGLMQAVRRFDPDRGFRLATYAMWWIRAAIQEYILRSWSLVKIGTTSTQKKLFFNLRRAKSAIAAFEEGDLRPEHLRQIAESLDVDESEVVRMNRRLAGTGDLSLNARVADEDDSGEWQDWIVDETPDADPMALAAERDEMAQRREMLAVALATLSDRERTILEERRLSDAPRNLEQIAKDHGVSRERIRQIELRAFEKIQSFLQGKTAEQERKASERRQITAAPPPDG